MPVIIGPPPVPWTRRNLLKGTEFAPPGGIPPGQLPPYVDLIGDIADELNRRLKPYSTDERVRIMHIINILVDGSNTVQGTPPEPRVQPQ